MARYELLNNIDHAKLRVTRNFADARGTVPVFPTEYAEVQREYPIFFRKDPENGNYHSVALLGFTADENLFLEGEDWQANYLPGYVAKGPFLIGFQEQWQQGDLQQVPVLHVDLDHPSVNFDDGEAVFLPHGGNSAYLDRISTILQGIHAGIEGGKAMYAAFSAHGLIQPMDLEIRLDEGHGVHLSGLYGIDRDALAALDARALHELHSSGFLEGAYLVLASLHNMRHLMARKQRRLMESADAS